MSKEHIELVLIVLPESETIKHIGLVSNLERTLYSTTILSLRAGDTVEAVLIR